MIPLQKGMLCASAETISLTIPLIPAISQDNNNNLFALEWFYCLLLSIIIIIQSIQFSTTYFFSFESATNNQVFVCFF